MTVYILKPDTTPTSINRQAAYLGFSQMGEHIELYEEDEHPHITLTKGDILIGGVGLVRDALAKINKSISPLPTIPNQLLPYTGRTFWEDTMANIRNKVNQGQTLFIKPKPQQSKLFTGHVVSSFKDLLKTTHVPDKTILECASPITLIREYRGFMLHGDLIDLRPYTGTPLAFPNPNTIQNVLQAWTTQPAACSIDFGVTKEGKTVLIEVNDATSLGHYGLSPSLYAQMIQARWNEIWNT